MKHDYKESLTELLNIEKNNFVEFVNWIAKYYETIQAALKSADAVSVCQCWQSNAASDIGAEDLLRELYDKFVMGGWEAHECMPYVEYFASSIVAELKTEKQELIEALRLIEKEASQFPKDVAGHETISGLCARVAREVLAKFNKPTVQGGQNHE